MFFFVKLNSGVVLDRLPCSSAHPFKVVKLIYLVANEGWNPLLKHDILMVTMGRGVEPH